MPPAAVERPSPHPADASAPQREADDPVGRANAPPGGQPPPAHHATERPARSPPLPARWHPFRPASTERADAHANQAPSVRASRAPESPTAAGVRRADAARSGATSRLDAT